MITADGAATSILSPSVDVVETDKSIELTAELPSVSQEDVDIILADDMLTIKGDKKVETTDETTDRKVIERSYGSFHRSIRLPYHVNADAVEAQFNDGILKVVLPKPPEIKSQTKKIAIKSS